MTRDRGYPDWLVLSARLLWAALQARLHWYKIYMFWSCLARGYVYTVKKILLFLQKKLGSCGCQNNFVESTVKMFFTLQNKLYILQFKTVVIYIFFTRKYNNCFLLN